MIQHHRDVLLGVTCSLVAALSLIRRAEEEGVKPSKACPSDKMFKQMLADYEADLQEARVLLNETMPPDD